MGSVNEEPPHTRFIDWIIDKIYLNKKGKRSVFVQNPDYQKAFPKIRDLYSQAWRWHGTGKYQYRDGEIVDVLAGIVNKNGLVPQYDDMDLEKGPYHSISTSPSRMYARLYSGLHFSEGKSLQNQYGDTKFWYRYFMAALIVDYFRKHKSKLLLFIRRDRRKLKEDLIPGYEAKLQRWREKVTTKNLKIIDLFDNGSDIKSNYPILIGLKDKSFEEVEIMRSLEKHERRSKEPVTIDKFTHIEVPLKNMSSTKVFLEKQRCGDINIIPMEWGEEYCHQFTFSQLVGEGKLIAK